MIVMDSITKFGAWLVNSNRATLIETEVTQWT